MRLHDRGPFIPLNCKIPEEVWSNKEVNYAFLRVFGCLAYVHIDFALRSELDAKSNKFFSLVIVTSSLVYVFGMKIRDVIFNEEVMYKDRPNIKLESPNTEVKKQEIVPLKDFPRDDMQDNDQEDQDNIAPEVEPQILVFELENLPRL
ncbi:hypothetical protein Pint_30156 [Pistacia integerrima]|uniref:Uncharacterized protein n=1 Tax=Pistacia integerrima TaxID=434235 RepID=A0ACC0X1Z8_9ROSI|nr:hypothetical protein Pint_30156 [Pistacia integerrima]